MRNLIAPSRARSFGAALALLLWLIGSLAPAQAKSVEVPLSVRGNQLFVEVEINGKAAIFNLDTGAIINIITTQAVERLGLEGVGKEKYQVGGFGEGKVEMSELRIPKLTIGGLAYDGMSALVFNKPDFDVEDGILGANFFESRVTTLDYQRRVMTLTDYEGWKPPEKQTVLPLTFIGSKPTVQAGISASKGKFFFQGNFALDIGSEKALILFAPFVEALNLRDFYKPALPYQFAGKGIGGWFKGDLMRVPSLTLGNIVIPGVVSEFSHEKRGKFGGIDGNIGAKVWQRFTLTLDYKNKRVFLIPNDAFSTPFDSPRVGWELNPEAGKTDVIQVFPDSPAAKAGIVAGDTIVVLVTVNGTPAAELADDAVVDAVGTVLRVKVRGKDGKEREVTLILRDLI